MDCDGDLYGYRSDTNSITQLDCLSDPDRICDFTSISYCRNRADLAGSPAYGQSDDVRHRFGFDQFQND